MFPFTSRKIPKIIGFSKVVATVTVMENVGGWEAECDASLNWGAATSRNDILLSDGRLWAAVSSLGSRS